jgi:hypothetical protein
MVFLPFKRYQEEYASLFSVKQGDRNPTVSRSASIRVNLLRNALPSTPLIDLQLQHYITELPFTFGFPAANASSTALIDEKRDIIQTSEKGHSEGWEGYREQALPEKSAPRPLRNLRYIILSVYRRLFSVVFIVNMAIFIASLARGGLHSATIATAVTGNLMVAVLMRQDYVINVLFEVFCVVPRSWPLWIRRICAKVYTIGGIHSGCGVSAAVWFTYLSEPWF